MRTIINTVATNNAIAVQLDRHVVAGNDCTSCSAAPRTLSMRERFMPERLAMLFASSLTRISSCSRHTMWHLAQQAKRLAGYLVHKPEYQPALALNPGRVTATGLRRVQG